MQKNFCQVFEKRLISLEFQIINKDLAVSAWSFNVNKKSCANPQLYADYLKFSALNDYKDGKNVTHVLLNYIDNKPEIVGFFSLRATSYQINFYDTDDDATEYHPACEIQYLAVSEKYEKQGYGKELMAQAVSTILEISEKTMAIEYLVLRSEKKAINFYKRFDFNEIKKCGKVPNESWNKNCTPMLCKLKGN